MRSALAARTDSENILESKYSDCLDLITDKIEKAVCEGKFTAYIDFGKSLDTAVQKYMYVKLTQNGYTANFTNHQLNGTFLQVAW